ncbi:unnamed protein product [Rhizophagus irregularis]|nr:unnamed protein product [Rhizophagus irregularis]
MHHGDDIAQAVKGLSGTSLVNLEPNRNDDSEGHEKNKRKKSKIKTIKGISKLFYWKWPSKLWNTPLHQPQPSISQNTTPEIQWTMPIAVESGKLIISLHWHIYYEITYTRLKILDEILTNEQPNDPNSFNSEEEIDIDQKFPLAKRWALKGNQKLGERGGKRMKKEVKALLELFFLNGNCRSEDRMNAQSMRDKLLKHVEAGEFEEEDIPKVNTIQNWINTYARVFKERATERDLAKEYENVLNISE